MSSCPSFLFHHLLLLSIQKFVFFRMLCNHHSSSSRSIRGGERAENQVAAASVGGFPFLLNLSWICRLYNFICISPQEFGCCRVARQSVSSGFESRVRRECAWLDGSGFHGVNLAFLDDTRANRSVDLIQSLAQSTSFFFVIFSSSSHS